MNQQTTEFKLAVNTGNMIASLNLQVAQLQVQIDQLNQENQQLTSEFDEAKKKLAKYDEKNLNVRGGDSEANRADTNNR